MRTGREEWAKRVARWKDSGLTAKEFATELGINPRSLVFWKWQLGKGSGGPVAESSAVSVKSGRGAGGAPSFVEAGEPPAPARVVAGVGGGRRPPVPATVRAQALCLLLARPAAPSWVRR